MSKGIFLVADKPDEAAWILPILLKPPHFPMIKANPMKYSRSWAVLYFLVSLLFPLAAYSQSPRILIYTRNEQCADCFVHDNLAASVGGITKICAENGIAAEATDDPSVFTRERIAEYDALVFSNTNNSTFDTDDQRLVFAHYIQAGGGFVGIHSASGSERDWPWFWACLGAKFRRHPQHQDFRIKVITNDHPATRHLGEVWDWPNGEFYFLDHLNPDIKILLAGQWKSLEDPGSDGYPGDVFGDYFPMAWYHEFDGGRQFYVSLGHYIDSYQNPEFLQLLLGGIQYAIGGEGNELNWDNARMKEIKRTTPGEGQ